ncbi:GGDEF domain-containing protein [Jiella marina]|uniref:GGDEF domain-containing protein n=1 Tax=Jiella sp. LLJ827 TaxID=2917712 RepID=UPI0021016103|nr:GGDEF domain-containing protein [Jiella sp. LLJ827]MCQ0989427.1 GGDEF domain-containing protein [Jiella sp. LLJ827]
MRQSFEHMKTFCGEFLLLVTAVTLASTAAAFWFFKPYGQSAMLAAAGFVVTVTLLSAVPYLTYVVLRFSSLLADNNGLMKAATTDRLTGVLNRQGFDKKMKAHLRALVGRPDLGLMVLIVDADHFKQINDSLGHPVGDQALKKIAATLMRSVRGSDAVGRLGGEEFVISLPCSDPQKGAMVAERLRMAINRLYVGSGTQSTQLSVSLGGVFLKTPQPFDRIYAAADANLYQSKQNGRNRTTITSIAARGRNRFGLPDTPPAQPALQAAR